MSLSHPREILSELLTLWALGGIACSVWVDHELSETLQSEATATDEEGRPLGGRQDASTGEKAPRSGGPRLFDASAEAAGSMGLLDAARDAGAVVLPDGSPSLPAKETPTRRLAQRYDFWRGLKDFEAPPALGDTSNGRLTAPFKGGSRKTRSGGWVRWGLDGRLNYTPPHPRFWGDDSFAFSPEGGRGPQEVLIAVQPGVLDGADLDNAVGHGFSIVAAREGDLSQAQLASIGDVDGDGFDDIIVGAPNVALSGALSGRSSGAVYVVRGRRDSAPISLQDLEAGEPLGWLLRGAKAFDRLGSAVSAAGDVNGDGRDDFLVAARGSDWDETRSGVVYVVFGSDRLGSVLLEGVRSGKGGGFAIVAGPEQNGFGSVVASAGDANGDGLADVVVGARDIVGRAYVVFGKEGPEPVFVDSLGGASPRGYAIAGSPEGARGLGYGGTLSPAGDVDGDGLDDILVGARSGAGAAYVIYGKRDSASISLEPPTLAPAAGLTWSGGFPGDAAGRQVALAPDVNGDGRLDFLVGSSVSHTGPQNPSGLTYLILGAEPPFGGVLSALEFGASGGIPIWGSSGGWGIGDANGDHHGDLLLRGFLLWGSPNPLPLSIAQLRKRPGAAAVPICDSGSAASPAGDINGDGLADFLVQSATQNVHVYFGWRAPLPWGPDTLAPPPGALTSASCSEGP